MGMDIDWLFRSNIYLKFREESIKKLEFQICDIHYQAKNLYF